MGISICYVSTILGAGMTSGKEIAVFFKDANFLSILFCSLFIGASATLFLYVGQICDGEISSFIFGKYNDYGRIIISILNLLFLSTMLGASETLAIDMFNFKGGGLIASSVVLLVYYGGSNYLKGISYILTPLTIGILIALLAIKGQPFYGEFKILLPLTYASLNSASSGLYSKSYSTGLKKGDHFIIGVFVSLLFTVIFTVIKSIIVKHENNSIPTLSVAMDTDLTIILSIVILSAIITSAVCNLSLAVGKLSSLKPIITLSIALLISSFGFNDLIKYAYPFIGAVYALVIMLTLYRVISLKLKVKFKGAYL